MVVSLKMQQKINLRLRRMSVNNNINNYLNIAQLNFEDDNSSLLQNRQLPLIK